MDDEATTVLCAVCGREVTVSLKATGYQDELERELPAGWTVVVRRVEATGEYVRIVLCPAHRPET